MTMSRYGPAWAALALAAAPVVSGCVGVLTQERSFGSTISDFTVKAHIEERLYASSRKTFWNIGTEVMEGRVLLTGRVRTQDERIEASRIAWTTRGVRQVVNEVEIGKPGGFGAYARDRWISTKIELRLLGDAGVEQENYNIETVNRTVYIFGIAQDESERDRVVAHCRAVTGVRHVVTLVRMKDDPRRKEPAPDGGV